MPSQAEKKAKADAARARLRGLGPPLTPEQGLAPAKEPASDQPTPEKKEDLRQRITDSGY